MLTDNIKDINKYYELGERFQKGFEYLQNTDMESLANGKYEIDGDNLFVSVQDYMTKNIEQGRFEAHKKYADIQYIIKGEEKLGYGNIDEYKPVTFYDDKNDIVFLEGEKNRSFVHAKAGDFVIFMPQDAHMPCIAAGNPTYVKKAVVKVKI